MNAFLRTKGGGDKSLFLAILSFSNGKNGGIRDSKLIQFFKEFKKNEKKDLESF
jgi:hypothetical protein